MLNKSERSSPAARHLVLSSEALKRARLIVGAQAQLLADEMDRGCLPSFDGPDALRLLAMILNQDDAPSIHDRPHVSTHLQALVLG